MSDVEVEVDTQYLMSWIRLQPERAARARRIFSERGGTIVANEMRSQAPRGRSGRLRGSITVEETPEGFSVYPKVHYAPYVEEGTGLFGPRGQLIFPRTARVLRWFEFGRPVFARHVRGYPGRHFVEKTHEVVTPRLAELARDVWAEVLT